MKIYAIEIGATINPTDHCYNSYEDCFDITFLFKFFTSKIKAQSFVDTLHIKEKKTREELITKCLEYYEGSQYDIVDFYYINIKTLETF